jgi:hypothetical protein
VSSVATSELNRKLEESNQENLRLKNLLSQKKMIS